jgi:hypothetical protein
MFRTHPFLHQAHGQILNDYVTVDPFWLFSSFCSSKEDSIVREEDKSSKGIENPFYRSPFIEKSKRMRKGV